MKLNILYEDDDIIVVIKPAKVPSQKDLSGDLDMVSAVASHISEKTKKTKPYVGLIHRLDRPVSGVMVFAKTANANKILSEEMRLKRIKKKYLAVVCGNVYNEKITLIDYIKKQGRNLSIVVPENDKQAKKAILHYKGISTLNNDEWGKLSLVEVELETGRHHQIRVQMANIGIPIWGDTKYNCLFSVNNDKRWYQIALCAYRLDFNHPITGKTMTFKIKPTEVPFNYF